MTRRHWELQLRVKDNWRVINSGPFTDIMREHRRLTGMPYKLEPLRVICVELTETVVAGEAA
jgi:hypothetical protein